MNRLSKFSVAFISVALASVAAAQVNDNWINGTGEVVWRNGTNDLCWRDADWMPATASKGCDGALVVKRAAAQAAKPAPAPKPAPVKVNLTEQMQFESGKSTFTAASKATLSELLGKLKDINVESISVVGYTDAIGSKAYNQKLSLARAEAIKTYLVALGMDASRIYTDAKDQSNPLADNTTEQGRAKNRRVDITVVGVKK